MNTTPFVISQHPAVMAEVLRRIRNRENMERVARQLGITIRGRRSPVDRVHTAKLGRAELVESNLPVR